MTPCRFYSSGVATLGPKTRWQPLSRRKYEFQMEFFLKDPFLAFSLILKIAFRKLHPISCYIFVLFFNFYVLYILYTIVRQRNVCLKLC